MNETETRLTSADIKKQIEQAKEEMKGSSLPITGQMANEINASESTTKETPKVEVKPEPATAAKGLETPTAEEASLKEWAKKKGIDWTTDDSVLKALQLSDRQFHEKRAKEKSNEQPVVPGYVPAPAYQPPAYQPVYAPPVNQRALIEQLARENNMLPEDFERVAKVSREVYEAAAQADRQKWRSEIESIKKAEQKNSAFRELSSDPALKRPDVAIEFNRLLEEAQSKDPHSFEQDPNAYIRVRDTALINCYRRNLEGQPLQEGVVPVPRLPSTPPRPLGKGSGGGSLEKEVEIGAEFFKLKSPQEKRAYLESKGLISAY